VGLRDLLKVHTLLFAAALCALATSIIASTGPVRAESPDYSIASTPLSNCISPGATASYHITVSSIGGFEGTVLLDANIDPNATNGPTLSPIPSSVDLTASQTVAFELTVSTTENTTRQAYTITVDGLSGYNAHWMTVYLAFQPLCGADNGVIIPPYGTAQLVAYASMAVALVGLTVATAIIYTRRLKPAY